LEKTDGHAGYIAHLLETLNDQSMSVIDFDLLRSWLVEVGDELNSHREIEDQLQLLRADYTQRIAGMVKAMAAVERKTDSWQEALSFVNSLSSLGATELVACYRRMSARFRDSFPTSFGLLRESGRKLAEAQDLSVYK